MITLDWSFDEGAYDASVVDITAIMTRNVNVNSMTNPTPTLMLSPNESVPKWPRDDSGVYKYSNPAPAQPEIEKLKVL